MDILTGDILTSYARVLAEWDGLMQLALFSSRSSRTGGEANPLSLSPSIISPLLIWMRQCWADFHNSRRWRPLLNAIKYATAFPMILLSLVAPRGAPSWILASFSNALYSAGWDLYVDWELHGRRKYYMFPHWSYAVAAILNASLRFTWILPLLGGPQAAEPAVDGLFTLQLLEVLRRFLWLPFRVESQQVQGQTVVGSLAITSSDELMIPLEGVKMLSP